MRFSGCLLQRRHESEQAKLALAFSTRKGAYEGAFTSFNGAFGARTRGKNENALEGNGTAQGKDLQARERDE